MMKKIYCSNCGQLIDENSKFCRHCGAAQQGEASAAYAAQAKPFSKEEISEDGRPPADDQTAHREVVSTDFVPRRHLNFRATLSFFISYLLYTSLVLVLLIIGSVIVPEVIVLLVAYLLILYLSSVLVYNSFSFEIDEQGFTKEYGIIHRNEVTIPYQHIHNVNITRSVSDIFLGLARINIETAGSSDEKSREVIGGSFSKAEGHLPGLSLAEAKKVHDILLMHANDRIS